MSSQLDSPKKKTILYVEDDEASRTLLRKIMELAGYRVLTAHDGLTGIDAARRYAPDIILMDINLPHMSGEVVTTRLRSMPSTNQIPIVALTAQASKGDRERALVSGCVGYITKPIDVDTLPDMVVEYLNGRRDELSTTIANRYHAEYSQSLVARLEAQVRQLENANSDLRRLDKMKADFISLTSHELRTPLALVLGYARMLEESGEELAGEDSDSEMPSLIESMVSSVGRLSDIITEVLNVSRIAMGQVDIESGPVDIQKLVESAVSDTQEAFKARNIEVEVAESGWPEEMVLADADLLTVAFKNLLGNALKYTPNGGTVRVGAHLQQGAIDIFFQDSGIGVDPEEHLLIFEQFYTAGDVQLHSTSKTGFMGGGLGLGLAIAKGAIEGHEGSVWVESEGRDEENFPGSSFHIFLPLRKDARASD